MRRALIGAAWLIALAAELAGVTLGADVFRSLLQPQTEPSRPITLQRPAVGEVRADYRPDGTPVWAIGHADGSVDVLSGFDTHTPGNFGKLLWWCETAHALENPHHGSTWDEFGVRLGGPAPTGLASWAMLVQGDRVELGAGPAAPASNARPFGPPPEERAWCRDPKADVVSHDFEGWRIWASPAAAVQSAPAGWILLEGELVADRLSGRVLLCALHGCADAAVVRGVEMPEAGLEFGPLGVDRFIARVGDRELTDLTRIVWHGRD